MDSRVSAMSDHAVLFRYRQKIGSVSTNIATLEVWHLDRDHREHFLANIAIPLAGLPDSLDLQSIMRQAREENIHAYVIDLGMVKWLNSPGLGFILQLKQAIRQRGGHVVFANLSDRIVHLITLVKLDHEFPTCASLAEAHRQVDLMVRQEASRLAGDKESRLFLLEPGGHFWKRRLVVFELDAAGEHFEFGRAQLHPNRLHPDLWTRFIKMSQFQRLDMILDVGPSALFQTWMGVYLDQLARLAVFSGGQVAVVCRSNLLREQFERLELEQEVTVFPTVTAARDHLLADTPAARVGR
jgi:anti-anti-sigma factor